MGCGLTKPQGTIHLIYNGKTHEVCSRLKGFYQIQVYKSFFMLDSETDVNNFITKLCHYELQIVFDRDVSSKNLEEQIIMALGINR